MYSRTEAEAYIVDAIENGDVEDASAEYDIDSIATTLYIAAGRTWDIGEIDDDTFWWIVQRNAIDPAEREAAADEPGGISSHTDQVADELYAARDRVQGARTRLTDLEVERDQALIRVYRTGAFTQKKLADMAGVSQQRVSQLLAR